MYYHNNILIRKLLQFNRIYFGLIFVLPSPALEKALSDAEGFFVACGNRAAKGLRPLNPSQPR